jgi:hypothetical protein
MRNSKYKVIHKTLELKAKKELRLFNIDVERMEKEQPMLLRNILRAMVSFSDNIKIKI